MVDHSQQDQFIHDEREYMTEYICQHFFEESFQIETLESFHGMDDWIWFKAYSPKILTVTHTINTEYDHVQLCHK